jgi:hypothetical protein
VGAVYTALLTVAAEIGQPAGDRGSARPTIMTQTGIASQARHPATRPAQTRAATLIANPTSDSAAEQNITTAISRPILAAHHLVAPRGRLAAGLRSSVVLWA